jgi:hypothetical protein
MKLSETKMGKNISVLLIGYPGSGKSIAAASFPGPIYIFDLDKRINSLLQFFGERSDIEYDYYGPDEYAKLDQKIKEIKSGNAPHRTYIMDSLTALARMAINYSIALRGGGKGNTKGVIQMTQIDDYNAESRVLSNAMDSFRGQNFKANFILTAHLVETNVKVLNGEDTISQRLLTGGKSIAAEIPAYFDEAYYIVKENDLLNNKVSYKSMTVPMNGINAKTALPIPPVIDFTMKDKTSKGLYQIIQEECKKNNIEIG